jgi:hypothetical protein
MAMLLDEMHSNPNARNALDNATPLHAAAAYDPSGVCVLHLIAHGADVNAQSDGGWTPLFSATFYDNLNAMRLLLESGSNPNSMVIYDEAPVMPLSLAIKRALTEASLLLYQFGARLTEESEYYEKYTYLQEAYAGGRRAKQADDWHALEIQARARQLLPITVAAEKEYEAALRAQEAAEKEDVRAKKGYVG